MTINHTWAMAIRSVGSYIDIMHNWFENCCLLNQSSIFTTNIFKNSLFFFAGHVFAFGESRALAIANMVLGLKEIQIRGEIRTNVDYSIDLLHVNFTTRPMIQFYTIVLKDIIKNIEF